MIRGFQILRLFVAAFFALNSDDVHGVAVKSGGDGFDLAFIPGRS
jgi:hypothetical protein